MDTHKQRISGSVTMVDPETNGRCGHPRVPLLSTKASSDGYNGRLTLKSPSWKEHLSPLQHWSPHIRFGVGHRERLYQCFRDSPKRLHRCRRRSLFIYISSQSLRSLPLRRVCRMRVMMRPNGRTPLQPHLFAGEVYLRLPSLPRRP
jgi:hypothetical protein